MLRITPLVPTTSGPPRECRANDNLVDLVRDVCVPVNAVEPRPRDWSVMGDLRLPELMKTEWAFDVTPPMILLGGVCCSSEGA